MKKIYENDFGEILGYEMGKNNGIIQFYFVDVDGKKSATKRMSVDYLMGGTF